MIRPKDQPALRERTEDGKRGYRAGVRNALLIVETSASLEDARATLERIVEAWRIAGDDP